MKFVKKNVGKDDRIARFLVAVIIVAFYYTHMISGSVATVSLVFSGIFILTGFVSFCPIYFNLEYSTLEKGNEHSRKDEARNA